MPAQLLADVNRAYETDGNDVAEQILINYFTSDIQGIVSWTWKNAAPLRTRKRLIQNAFNDHFSKMYVECVPVFLSIIDGAVNDFTKSKGFFADGTVFDSCDYVSEFLNGLSQVKDLLSKPRTLTNCDPITIPYRNGILHGRDLNYGNAFVSCKCVSLLFAVADWMREMGYSQVSCLQDTNVIASTLESTQRSKLEIAKWEKRNVCVGQDIPASGSSSDYICFPYCIPVVELMNAWKCKNYGVMGSHLRSLFPSSTSDKKCAGLCRKNFERRALEQYAITYVEERAYGLSKVTVNAYINGCAEPTTMVFGCCLETPPEGLSPTSRENGRWYLIPWDIGIPYLNFD